MYTTRLLLGLRNVETDGSHRGLETGDELLLGVVTKVSVSANEAKGFAEATAMEDATVADLVIHCRLELISTLLAPSTTSLLLKT
mmetsp:Transcript_22045/g.32490  ORF Transcript_22045/g.32490 Transcript_22045/m.32490 type:complete len:85 (+) Transcript_22045:868-1122(+)